MLLFLMQNVNMYIYQKMSFPYINKNREKNNIKNIYINKNTKLKVLAPVALYIRVNIYINIK